MVKSAYALIIEQESSMSDAIAELLVKHIPRDLVLTMDELLEAGAIRAFAASKGMDEGHLPHVVGNLRHFYMNQQFHAALAGNDADPSPIRGNALIVGHKGMFRIGRFNMRHGPWYNARRSKQRMVMAAANKAMEPLVLPDFFNAPARPIIASVFFVGVFSGSMKNGERPLSIEIAVPDSEMKDWLLREPVQRFAQRYVTEAVQPDEAVPTLKVAKASTLPSSGES